MKKKCALTLAAILTLSAVPVYAGIPAAPTASKVTVNGEAKAFEAYNINDNNYFKLRDIAYVLNDTTAAFAVGWDDALKTISLDRYGKYEPTGTEMKVSGTKDIKDAVESSSKLLIDGEEVALKAYTINGNTYFKLRDLGTAIGFNVGWDDASQTISITTAVEENVLTAEEVKAMGMTTEITGIWSDFGMITEGVRLAEGSSITEVAVYSATVCGETAIAPSFPGTFVAERSGQESAADFAVLFQYSFPENILVLNADPQAPDYGKTNPVSVTYEIATEDGALYKYTTEYNLLVEGNGGLWIE